MIYIVLNNIDYVLNLKCYYKVYVYYPTFHFYYFQTCLYTCLYITDNYLLYFLILNIMHYLSNHQNFLKIQPVIIYLLQIYSIFHILLLLIFLIHFFQNQNQNQNQNDKKNRWLKYTNYFSGLRSIHYFRGLRRIYNID